MRLRRVTHSGAYNLVEHPYRDLAIVALVVIIHLTAKHALRSGLAAADNDVSSVQRMPPILHPPDIRLVIILVGTCTTRPVPTCPSARTHPMVEKSTNLNAEQQSSRCRSWAGSTIGTSAARPDAVTFSCSNARFTPGGRVRHRLHSSVPGYQVPLVLLWLCARGEASRRARRTHCRGRNSADGLLDRHRCFDSAT